MSRASASVVRMAARLLPVGIRERYREQWLADLEGAPDAGLAPSGIALGAALFTITVDRDAPDVLGMPASAESRRRARWSVALLGSAGVLAVGQLFNGPLSGNSTGAIAVANTVLAALMAVALVTGVASLWRAAMLASPLAKISAAIVTAAIAGLLASFSLGEWGWLVGTAALFLGIAGGTCGLIAWANAAAQPIAADAGAAGTSGVGLGAPGSAAPDPARISLHPAIIVALAVAAVLAFGFVALFTGIVIIVVLLAIPLVAAFFALRFTLRSTRTTAWRPRSSSRALVAVTSAVVLGSVVVGAFDLLVWAPLDQAPAYTLDQIWAALSPGDASAALVACIGWIVIWGAAALTYIAAAHLTLHRGAVTARTLVSIGLLITGFAVFFQFWAGFSLGMSISDTLPPFSGSRTTVSVWYALAGQLALVGALLGGVAPRAAVLRTATA